MHVFDVTHSYMSHAAFPHAQGEVSIFRALLLELFERIVITGGPWPKNGAGKCPNIVRLLGGGLRDLKL